MNVTLCAFVSGSDALNKKGCGDRKPGGKGRLPSWARPAEARAEPEGRPGLWAFRLRPRLLCGCPSLPPPAARSLVHSFPGGWRACKEAGPAGAIGKGSEKGLRPRNPPCLA